jgi:hypothetical protein
MERNPGSPHSAFTAGMESGQNTSVDDEPCLAYEPG